MADESISKLEVAASDDRVEFDVDDDNGLIITDKYIPEELLSEILINVDPKSLLQCHLVCKRWYTALQTYVWRKKAEFTISRPLHFLKSMPWFLYYVICSNKSFEKNLLKNHSGKKGLKKHWKILNNGGDKWKVECPPAGVPPLPSDPVFEGDEHCFVSSYHKCSKEQTVDLVGEGFPPQLLDQIQPPIVISEWYSCRWDCAAIYECSISLIDHSGSVLDTFNFRDDLVNETQNTWLNVKHEFTDYGPGLRKVNFRHGGVDKQFWAGHYGSKMAGACVRVNLPKQGLAENEESDLSTQRLAETEEAVDAVLNSE